MISNPLVRWMAMVSSQSVVERRGQAEGMKRILKRLPLGWGVLCAGQKEVEC